jgi:hypothetical protein
VRFVTAGAPLVPFHVAGLALPPRRYETVARPQSPWSCLGRRRRLVPSVPLATAARPAVLASVCFSLHCRETAP